VLAAADVQVPVRILGLPDSFVEHGAPATLLSGFGLDAEGVAAAVRELLGTLPASALAG
jgi:1-deoxy-D-xylulose-5-phosphate synthase